MIRFIISFIILLFIIGIDVYTDNKKWGKINHIRGFLLRIPFVGLDVFYYYPHINLIYLDLFVIAGIIYTIVFDPMINKIHKLKWNHLGTTEFTDRIFKTSLEKLLVKINLLIITLWILQQL